MVKARMLSPNCRSGFTGSPCAISRDNRSKNAPTIANNSAAVTSEICDPRNSFTRPSRSAARVSNAPSSIVESDHAPRLVLIRFTDHLSRRRVDNRHPVATVRVEPTKRQHMSKCVAAIANTGLFQILPV